MGYWDGKECNKDGHLMLGGCDAVSLARRFGTPLYVMEEDKIRSICRAYKETLDASGMDGLILYASKAFLTTAMCRIVDSEGLGMDVVSAGELFCALHAGFPPKKLYLHGNNKVRREIEMAVRARIGRIVIDSCSEIELIDAVAAEENAVIDVSLRVKPGVEAHTHEYIKTGMEDSKFGFGIHDGEAARAIELIMAKEHLHLAGLHCHIGSQIFELEPFEDTVGIMTDFTVDMNQRFGCELSEINFGGGFGIHYLDTDRPLTVREYAGTVIGTMKQQCEAKGLRNMRVVMEPGRSIVGEAGTTLYTIGTIKDIPGIRTYISVDGGMTDNPRPALYQAKYTALIANRADAAPNETVSVAGRCCESGDMLIWDAELNSPQVGDTLAVFSTGAYNYSMAGNYNKVPIPAVVLVSEGRASLIVERESLRDLISHDRVPEWLLD